MKQTDRNAVGPHTWLYLRRRPDYGSAWRETSGPPSFETAPFPIRVQSEADGKAAAWGLLAWQDPHEKDGPASPFWVKAPMLKGEVSPEATPLADMVAASGTRLDGLRLKDGGLVLKIERGGRAVQLRIDGCQAFKYGDGIVLKQDFGLELPFLIAQLQDLWNVTGGRVSGPARERTRDRRVGTKNS